MVCLENSILELNVTKIPFSLLAASVAVLSLNLALATHATAGPSTTLSVTGEVSTPIVYDYNSLSVLSSTTQVDQFSSGSGAQTHDYQGTSVWGLVNTSGVIVNPAVKNDILNKYVLATGTDGYKVVYSMGELNPNFGNTPALVAYAENKGSGYQPLTTDGFARTTAPLDTKGGRYVSNLDRLNVATSASNAGSLGGGASTSLAVSGDVLNARSFDLASLKSLASTTYTAGGHSYTGVSLWSLLSSTIGLKTTAGVKNDLLDMYVVATGTDGYKALFSMGELSSDFGNQPDLLAYQMDGTDLTTGIARMIVGNDNKAGRWVSGLYSLEVFHATESSVPLPPSYAMLVGGILMLGFVGRNRRIMPDNFVA